MCSFSKKSPVEYLAEEDSECYPMNYEKKGLCYIFNHKKFNGPKLKFLNERRGTDVDAKQLKVVFENLGFEVPELFEDCTCNQIGAVLQNVKKVHHSKYSCFVCCILSYGAKGYLCSSDDIYPVQSIYHHFYGDKCTSFAGKPKIFVIQACPGQIDVSSKQSTDFGGQNMYGTFRIPTKADFLVVYSTVPGDLSLNLNGDKGSWFIDSLCSTIENYISKMDLLQLLSVVNYKLSAIHKSKGLTVEVPCVTSTLTRDVKLFGSDSGDAEIVRNPDLFYDIYSHNSKKGKVLIFNHEFYENGTKYEQRKGTNNDVKHLKVLFKKKLNFEDVNVFKEEKKESILEKLRRVAKESHEEYSCFICCILTHGNCGTLSAYDQDYEIDDILSLFYNKWCDKPKIFLLQACQGKKLDPGCEMVSKLSLTESSESDSDLEESVLEASVLEASVSEASVSEASVNFRHLSHPDFLLMSSAPPGYYSFKNPKIGSWFVKDLYDTFTSSGAVKDFLQLFTETNRQVAKRASKKKEKEADPEHDKKQTLCLTSTLTRNLDFRSFN